MHARFGQAVQPRGDVTIRSSLDFTHVPKPEYRFDHTHATTSSGAEKASSLLAYLQRMEKSNKSTPSLTLPGRGLARVMSAYRRWSAGISAEAVPTLPAAAPLSPARSPAMRRHQPVAGGKGVGLRRGSPHGVEKALAACVSAGRSVHNQQERLHYAP